MGLRRDSRTFWKRLTAIGAFAVAAALATSPIAHAAQANACKPLYRVKKGDTLSQIVKDLRSHSALSKAPIYGKHGLLRKMIAFNKRTIKNPAYLRVGAKLRVPQVLLATSAATSCNLAYFNRVVRHPAATDILTQVEISPITESTELGPVQTVHHIDSEDLAYDLPEVARITLSGSASSGSGTFTPGYGIDTAFGLGLGWSFTASADGLGMTYLDSVFGNYSTNQAQVKVGAEYALTPELKLGLGYRHFAFGYTNPAGTAAWAQGFYVSAEASRKLTSRWELVGTADLRSAVSVSSIKADDGVNGGFQFAGWSLTAATHYSVMPGFFLGPYLFYDSNSLGWTQATAASGTNSFADAQYGLGLHFGWGF